ncbi:MAG: AzlC family ABC transporter permease [Pelagimonas sp.]|jgi:predicted branched-subunit amino acid permease|nr:AzlC family ABC transporter permease [Pelagimonas sp.]
MAQEDVKTSYWRGVRDGVPFIFVICPFAMLFGVISVEAGLNVYEALAFSVVVIAGAAQFTALHLMSENTPTFIVLASALMVNLRMAMYSAALTPHLGSLPLWKRGIVAYLIVDQSYASAALDYEKNPDQTPAQKLGYFLGVCSPIIPFWYACTILGALVGEAVPPSLGLDFALPITFIAMIGPALRTWPHRVAAIVATAMALCFAWLPYNLGLMVAAVTGMMAGAEMERRQNKESHT